jgi:hypothetical protein
MAGHYSGASDQQPVFRLQPSIQSHRQASRQFPGWKDQPKASDPNLPNFSPISPRSPHVFLARWGATNPSTTLLITISPQNPHKKIIYPPLVLQTDPLSMNIQRKNQLISSAKHWLSLQSDTLPATAPRDLV